MLGKVLRTVVRWLTSLSAALCVLTLVLWLRSYWIRDYVGLIGTRRALNFEWARGSCLATFRYGGGEPVAGVWSKVIQMTWRRSPVTIVRSMWTPEQGETVYLRMGERFFIRHYPHDPANKSVYEVLAPGWLPPLVFAPGLWFWGRRKYRRILTWRRRKAGLCEACGYDVRESSGRCPECGKAIAARAGERHMANEST
jgi:predicted RNA-binding Zn-ribbon protein involved in translation (DUF1610 family)